MPVNIENIPFPGSTENRRRLTLDTNTRLDGPYSDQGIRFPNMPVIHPVRSHGENSSYDYGVVSFPLTFNLGDPELSVLPENVRITLESYGINNDDQVKLFICMQNMPWNNGEQLFLRPHAWLHDDAPVNGSYNRSSNIVVGVLNPSTGDIATESWSTVNLNTSTNGDGNVVYSSDNDLRIDGLNNLDQTQCLISVCIDRDNRRAVVTMHTLLNQMDYNDSVRNINSLAAAHSGSRGSLTYEEFMSSHLGMLITSSVAAMLEYLLDEQNDVAPSNIGNYSLSLVPTTTTLPPVAPATSSSAASSTTTATITPVPVTTTLPPVASTPAVVPSATTTTARSTATSGTTTTTTTLPPVYPAATPADRLRAVMAGFANNQAARITELRNFNRDHGIGTLSGAQQLEYVMDVYNSQDVNLARSFTNPAVGDQLRMLGRRNRR